MNLVDTCYGVTGGNLYVCNACGARVIARRTAPTPTCTYCALLAPAVARQKALATAEKLQDMLGALYKNAEPPRFHEGRAYDAAASVVSALRRLVTQEAAEE